MSSGGTDSVQSQKRILKWARQFCRDDLAVQFALPSRADAFAEALRSADAVILAKSCCRNRWVNMLHSLVRECKCTCRNWHKSLPFSRKSG